ncbi:hypothetical protein [Frankia sp. AgB32]|uniref:hypothetical protein n=1 Tax=Frankia sp. AgB32 TaxID=631119 RepID=UPI00200BE953|nr:hypothetical protein [Frankia sp. AgB32]MCK9898235.1 hypothetical protein [Frankia sp. AgB32]
MSHAVEPSVDETPAYYRRNFGSFSLGTEEELVGAAIEVSAVQFTAVVDPAKAPDVQAPAKVFGLVGPVNSTEVLVEITRDLPVLTSANSFKIELRTTPTERNDDAGWQRRRAALDFTIDTLYAQRNQALANLVGNEFTLTALDAAYTLRVPQPVVNTDVQVTVGIPAAQIGIDMSVEDAAHGILHPLLNVTWYEMQFEDDSIRDTFGADTMRRHAIVMSAILKCAKILKANRMNLATATAKNAWGVLPRHPLSILLAQIPDAEESLVVAGDILRAEMPTWPNAQAEVIDKDVWEAAKLRVFGRNYPNNTATGTTIAGSVALLFEYRAPDRRDGRFTGRFWRRPGD